MRPATIELHGFQSARTTAAELARQVAPASLEVVIRCRQLQAITTSFADELVIRLLVEHDLRRLVLEGATARNKQHFQTAAQRRSVDGRLSTRAASHSPSSPS